MKWIYHIRQKMQVALLLGIILIIVYANNVMESRNVSELGGSFSSVFEDRLLVESYIYKLSDNLYQKKIMLDQCASVHDLDLKSKIDSHNKEISALIQSYENTRLTEIESRVFDDFKKNVGQIADMEDEYLNNRTILGTDLTQLDNQFLIATRNLGELSLIQIEEAKKLNDGSKKIVAGSTLQTQFELAMLVVIGLIIQALIFATKSFSDQTFQKHQLN